MAALVVIGQAFAMPEKVNAYVETATADMLVPTKTEEKEVPLELRSQSAGTKPKTAVE